MEPGERSRDSHEQSVAQILAAIKASGLAVQVNIEAMALGVNLPRSDLRKVAERSIETEQQVSTVQEELDACSGHS
ncbi:hypothetical protein NDU88_003701 [Pleurodeles waltl]|uniref:Uncharacterized protein n=1 Tax=Pleurodeles waltl TaxID=8319 RepID=A0AAV7LG00_PLEWA|nr:hypothetical protein NDU88_003701 [Pleurodeles waltl]